MKRSIPLAVFLVSASLLPASAQSTVPIAGQGTINFNMSSGPSMAGDIMNGQGIATGGVDASVVASSGSRIGIFDDPFAARDGCINYPRQAHNSADCSRIIKWDPSWVLPKKPLSEMTGAEENMVRSYHILTGKSDY